MEYCYFKYISPVVHSLNCSFVWIGMLKDYYPSDKVKLALNDVKGSPIKNKVVVNRVSEEMI